MKTRKEFFLLFIILMIYPYNLVVSQNYSDEELTMIRGHLGKFQLGGKGTVKIIPTTPVRAESYQNYKIVYTVPIEGMAVGGSIRIGLHCNIADRANDYPTHAFSKWQAVSTDSAGFVEVLLSNKNSSPAIEFTKPEPGKRGEFEVIIKITGNSLNSGDEIILDWGGKKGVKTPIIANNYLLPVREDLTGNGTYFEIEKSPVVRVIGKDATQFHAVLQPRVAAGERQRFKVSAIDEHGNMDEHYTGTVHFSSSDKNAALPPSYTFTMSDRGFHWFETAVAFQDTGYHFVSVSDGKIEGRSNPVKVTSDSPEYKIFFGDIHCHSPFSDGSVPVNKQYFYARNTAGLDFGALTDHEYAEKFWKIILDEAEKNNDPGNFITFPAYEWSSESGHQNVYFISNPGQMYYSRKYGDQMKDPAHTEILSKPSEVWSKYKGRKDVLFIPHHTLGAPAHVDWNYYNPEFNRVLEIFSVHGSGEYYGNAKRPVQDYKGSSAQDALNKGYKFGFIGGSDHHEVGMGSLFISGNYPHWSWMQHFKYRAGLAAVLAKNLTRESIFEALMNRRCYATTGERILLDFSIDGHGMGEEYTSSAPPQIRVEVVASSNIEKVEIIKNGEIIHHAGISLYNEPLIEGQNPQEKIKQTNYAFFNIVDKSFCTDSATNSTKS